MAITGSFSRAKRDFHTAKKYIRSGVEYLIQKFSNLSFDARHEAVHGMGRIISPEKCEELADSYGKGEEFLGW